MSKWIFIIFFFLILGASFFVFEGKREKALTIYTYSSFASNWGAGPILKEKFEEQCNCKINFLNVGDSRTIVRRLEVEKANSGADLVLGLDQFGAYEASQILNWKELEYKKNLLKSSTHNIFLEKFVPYDWAPLTFVYRKGTVEPPKKIIDLLNFQYEKKISLMDPRTSSPGFQFVYWLIHQLGYSETKEFLLQLKDSIFTISSSWSTAYGLFKSGKTDMVFSYITSPVYHWIEENEFSYSFVNLDESLPKQIEYMGILKSCRNCELAEKFIDFTLSQEVQKIIMEKNYMLPIIPEVKKGSEFDKIPDVETIPLFDLEIYKNTLLIWKDSFS